MKKIKILIFAFWVLILISGDLFAIGTNQNVIEKGVSLNAEYSSSIQIFTDKKALNINVYNWTIDNMGNSIIFQDKPFTGDWLKIPAYVEKKDASANFIEIPYTVKITSSKQIEYLGKIMISEVADDKDQGINIAMGLGIPIYVWLNNEINLNKKSCGITKIDYNAKTQLLRVLVSNNANVHIRPQIDFKIEKTSSSILKKKPAKLINLTSSWPVLAKDQRWFTQKIVLTSGTYKIHFIISFGKEYNLEFKKEIIKTLMVKGQ